MVVALQDQFVIINCIWFLSMESQLDFVRQIIQEFFRTCLKCHSSKKQLKYKCKRCLCAFYCSEKCLKNDKANHEKYCKFQQKQVGATGLQNLGNTCYMNSCLQCLSHTLQLTKYFLKGCQKPYLDKKKNQMPAQSKQKMKQKNPQEKLKNHTKIVKAYSEFIRNVWVLKKSTYSPKQIKYQMGKIQKQFQNQYQQDASQFYSSLVDALSLGLNRVRNKQDKKLSKIYGNNDKQKAKISWLYHLQSQQSIIVDLMTGLYKSNVICQTCNRSSKNFQKFTFINLPIPQSATVNNLTIFVFYSFFRNPVRKLKISFHEVNPQKFNQKAIQLVTQRPPKNEQMFEYEKIQDSIFNSNRKNQNSPSMSQMKSNLRLYLLSQNRQIHYLPSLTPGEYLDLIKLEKVAYLIQLTPEQRQIIDKFQITYFYCYYKNKKRNNLWIKKPIFVDLAIQNGLQLTKKFLKQLYTVAYKFPQVRTIYGTNGKDYIAYEKQMLNKRPFKLVLYKKKSRTAQNIRFQVMYQNDGIYQLEIEDDILLIDCYKKLQKYSSEQKNLNSLKKNYELGIQINQFGFQNFSFESFNKFLKQVQNISYEKKVQNNQLTLQKCFDSLQQQQILRDNLFCQWCQKKTSQKKRMHIFKTPHILVLQLNRFKCQTNWSYTKDKKVVKIPLQLNISKYVLDKSSFKEYIEEAKLKINYIKPEQNVQQLLKYSESEHFQLYGVIHHTGTLNAGHYVAYVNVQNLQADLKKPNSNWYLFNDSAVEKVQYPQLSNAYMLFYRKI